MGWGRIYISENPARERNSSKRTPLNWTPCYGALEVRVLLLLNDEKYGQLLRNLFTVPRSARGIHDVLYFC